ncbi:MAG: GAF domain-containing protein, partial [Pyrinomonadaceae bacterium]
MNPTNHKFGEQSLKILSKIGDALSGAGSPKTAFARALDVLRDEAGFLRSFVVLFHAANEKLQPFATNNFTIVEFRRLENKAEKSFIGTVFESGKSVVIPRTSLEPSFAAAFEINRNLETSCVCVPVSLGGRNLGAFGAEFEYDSASDYNEITDFMVVVA